MKPDQKKNAQAVVVAVGLAVVAVVAVDSAVVVVEAVAVDMAVEAVVAETAVVGIAGIDIDSNAACGLAKKSPLRRKRQILSHPENRAHSLTQQRIGRQYRQRQ
jgi:hypothetical protein